MKLNFKPKLNQYVKRLIVYLIIGVIINIFVGALYFIFLSLNLSTILSLSLSYIFGVFTSIYFNKNLTFKFKTKSLMVWYKFSLLHIIAYIVCQATNESILYLMSTYEYVLILGFIFSIGLAAITNFLGMSIVIKNEEIKRDKKR